MSTEQQQQPSPPDHLTQIQDCLDQFATQLFASFYYTTKFAAPAHIPGQAYQPGVKTEGSPTRPETPSGPAAATTAAATQTSVVDSQQQPPNAPIERNPGKQELARTVQELVEDLVVKEQQIEMLLRELPGVDRTQAQQEDRLRELNTEMEAVRREWDAANERRDVLRQRVERVILKTRRV